MNYIFSNINAGLEIKAPSVSVATIIDDFNGSAQVNILISLGNPQADAVKFIVELGTYTYESEQAFKSDVETWIAEELKKHEV